jgi:hypothetical protein
MSANVWWDGVSVSPADLMSDFLLQLLYTVMPSLGLMPLHGALCRRGSRCVFVSGLPEAGKSTVATALQCEGWEVLSDDLALVDVGRQPSRWSPVSRPLKVGACSVDLLRRSGYDPPVGRQPAGHDGRWRVARPAPGLHPGLTHCLPDAIACLDVGARHGARAERLAPAEAAELIVRANLGPIHFRMPCARERARLLARACQVGRAVPSFRIVRTPDLRRLCGQVDAAVGGS